MEGGAASGEGRVGLRLSVCQLLVVGVGVGGKHSNLCSHFQSSFWCSTQQYLTTLHRVHSRRGCFVGVVQFFHAHTVQLAIG